MGKHFISTSSLGALIIYDIHDAVMPKTSA